MKKIAILQSNYIPWKGYFDLIAAVDEFIIYDDVQYTKNDWRNRNKIKTPKGIEWISIPVGKDINRLICDVALPTYQWQEKHWKTLVGNYSQAAHFGEIAAIFEPLYRQHSFSNLSKLNRAFIDTVCRYLGITTKITHSWDYIKSDGKTERLAELCAQAGGTEYISGPSAKDYIEEPFLTKRGVKLTWFDYDSYPEYPQLWGTFDHHVTILDLLFNCGKDSPCYMRYVRS